MSMKSQIYVIAVLTVLFCAATTSAFADEFIGTFEGCRELDGVMQCRVLTQDAVFIHLNGDLGGVSAAMPNTPKQIMDVLLNQAQIGQPITVYASYNSHGELVDVTNVILHEFNLQRVTIRGRMDECKFLTDTIYCSVTGDNGTQYIINTVRDDYTDMMTNTSKEVFRTIDAERCLDNIVLIDADVDGVGNLITVHGVVPE